MNEERVRVLAYEIWEKAGYPNSDGVEFWLQAEAELSTEPNGPSLTPFTIELEPVVFTNWKAAKVSATSKKTRTTKKSR